MVTASEDKHQIKIKEENGIKCMIPIRVKEKLSTQYAVIDLMDKEGLPDIPAENFNQPLKVEYDIYSKSDVTDEPDYVPDDIPLNETDEEDLAGMQDRNINSIVHQIEATMKQVSKCNQSDLLTLIYSNISVFFNIFQYISISHSIFNICEYLTGSLPSSNDVNLFVLLFYFHFRCYFSGKVFVCNVKCERVREIHSLNRSKSPLLFIH